MPNHRKPTAIKEASGTLDHNPQRRNHFEPIPPEGVPEPPDHLPDIAKIEWYLVAEILAKMRVLTLADRQMLELYCDTYARWRTACQACDRIPIGETGHAAVNGIRERAVGHLRHQLIEMGLTPASRSKIIAGGFGKEKQTKPDFSVFFGGGNN